ncbi:hypothetical protein ERJ75_001650200 [Trypanosoma vivax]|uniref:Mitochondrial RNA binding protein n=1 Tax=Trypanosoma vivax (strain Y486) TaxID=1055687 RepID=G0U9L6_TRYVY|nr:hypothetical protein TRVL_04879 [Trypanosoma vivax]KAH8605142.1 hypothetical protein ERJ75_001650200 [Trypanosoma vivax]CCC54302.1 conserved hypothetical protein [Trypanosoma vivax Y486]
MSHPFEKAARDIAFRMRSKVHKQSYSNAISARERRRLSPTGLLAMERLAELAELQKVHQRTLDPAIRTSATQILRTLPLFSTDEDPQFIHTQKALRTAAYFGAVDLPVTYALINQHTRNAFLLDAVAMSSFFHTLGKLQHPQTAEIVGILLPRLRELASELVPYESINVLRVLKRSQINDVQLVRVITDTVVHTVADTPLADICQCATLLLESNHEEASRILDAAGGRLCNFIETSPDISAVKGLLVDVSRIICGTCKGPRRLMNSVARRSIDIMPELSPLDITHILKSFHLSSYRHLRAVKVLSSSLATHLETNEVTREHKALAVTVATQALAHFYVTDCDEIVLSLVNAAVGVLEGLNMALTLLGCVRLRCVSPRITTAIDTLCASAHMRRYIQNAHSLPVTSRLLYALTQAGRSSSTDDAFNISALLDSVLRSPGTLPVDCLGFLSDAVCTLESDNCCTNEAMRCKLRRVRERLSNNCCSQVL